MIVNFSKEPFKHYPLEFKYEKFDIEEFKKDFKEFLDMENILDNGKELTEKQAAEFAAQVEQAAAEETIQAAAADPAAAADVANGVLTPEAFEKNFFQLFDIVGDLWDMPDFKINHDKPFEIAGAKVSAAKLYLMANKYKMLHFLIEPCGGWFGDTIAICCFAGAKANVACNRFTGKNLTGYFKRFMKKTGEQVTNNGFFARIFKGKPETESEEK